MNFNTLQHEVFDRDDPGFLEQPLEDGKIDINYCDPEHGTLLCAAASRYCVNTINFLLDKNADINVKDTKGKTPLHCAIFAHSHSKKSSSDIDTVKLLMDRGANLYQKDNAGDTPLRMAARLNSPLTFMLLTESVLIPDKADEMDYLINEGLVDKDYLDPDQGTSVLSQAASLYSFGTAMVLLEAGSSVNSAATDGVTPLHYAIGGMHESSSLFVKRSSHRWYVVPEEMVQMLLFYGAGNDFDVKDDEGNTPLHVAALMNAVYITQRLIERGAWRHLKTKNVAGYTAEEIALDNKEKIKQEVALNRTESMDRRTERMEELLQATYENQKTIACLTRARLDYDLYIVATKRMSRLGIPDDILKNVATLPAQFHLFNGFTKTPQKIYRTLWNMEWIGSIDGVVRKILYPDNDIPSFLIDQHEEPFDEFYLRAMENEAEPN